MRSYKARLSQNRVMIKIFVTQVILSLVMIMVVMSQCAMASDLVNDFKICHQLQNEYVQSACFNAVSKQADKAENVDGLLANINECRGFNDGDRHRCYLAIVASEEISSPVASTHKAVQTNFNPVQEDNDLGAEHLARKKPQNKDDDHLISAVVKMTIDRTGRRIFFLENGQIWAQNEPDFISIPKKRKYFASVRRGGVGTYRLRIDGKGRITRVRRLK